MRVRAGHLIGVPIGIHILLLQAGEVPVQRLVVILPVAVPKRHAHAEANDPLYPDPHTFRQDLPHILRAVVDKGQDRAQPHDGGDAVFLHLLQHFDPPLGVAHMGLYDPAEIVVVGRQGHLHHAFRPFVDLVQQINVPENPVGLGLDGRAEAVFQDDLQALSGQSQALLAVHIGVRHGASADHALFPFQLQGFFQQLRRVLLHFDILEGMGELVASAPAVAVDAAMGAAPVDVHAAPSPAAGQYSLCVYKMHVAVPIQRMMILYVYQFAQRSNTHRE